MGKKKSGDTVSENKKRKKATNMFTFLGCKFKDIDLQTARHHIIMLILVAVLAKFAVVVVTAFVFQSFVDLFDISIYFNHVLMVVQGQLPFSPEFQYPILILVPLLLALMPALLFQNATAFVLTFQALMVLCDIVTILCVYLIGLRLYDERTAFRAGLIYGCAFSAAYFVITKYDAFPASLLMLAVLFTVYRQEVKGYAAVMLGFFTKVFPLLALPFLVLFNSRRTSLKQEIVSAIKIVVPIFAVLFLPLFFISPETLWIYIPVRSDLGYYSNTLTFTVFSWIHDVFHVGISIGAISAIMYIIMGAGILALLYIAYRIPRIDLKLLIGLILCTIVLAVVCAKVRSPQYIVWYTPLICLLAADDIRKIILLFIYQALAYVEFPLMFGAFYTATEYTDTVLSSGWMITLVVFTLEYLALFGCLWFVVSPREIYRKMRQKIINEPPNKTTAG